MRSNHARWVSFSIVALATFLFGGTRSTQAQGPAAGTAAPAAPTATPESDALAPAPLNAILTKIVGLVKVNGKPVVRSQLLEENQVVETGEGASASIFFGRDGIVHLSADAKLTINTLNLEKRANGVDLAHGKARVLVRSGGTPRTFTIRTRTATMGVRGTHILIDVPKDQAQPPRFVTFEGKAEVRPNLPQIQLPPGAPPPPAAPVIALSKSETVSVAESKPGAKADEKKADSSANAPRAETRPEPRKMDAIETQKLASEVVPLRDIQTPADVKVIADAPRGGDRPGGKGPNGPAGTNGPASGPNASASNSDPRRGAQDLLPGFGFGTNGGFGFTGGGTLLGQPGAGAGASLDPVADGAGVARITIQLQRQP